MIALETLRSMPLFAKLSAEREAWLCDNISEVQLVPGEVLVSEGEPAKGFFILLDGEIVITKFNAGEEMPAGRISPVNFFGEVPILAGIPTQVSVRAVAQSRLVRVNDAAFDELLATDRHFRTIVFQTVSRRMSGLEGFVRQREKMAALGTLSAGLAHELNNPAAAVGRAVDRMHGGIEELVRRTRALDEAGVNAPCYAALESVIQQARDAAEEQPADPLAETEREDVLYAWMIDRAVKNAVPLAAALAGSGVTPEQLDSIAAEVHAGALDASLAWLAARVEFADILKEADRGSRRIAEMVKAMKAYSYMDQAPQQEVDLHDGIDDTLTILKHKLKYGITVTRDYDRSLPRIPVYGSELNQVWTNLIDNAADAMAGKGAITVRTRREGELAIVEIQDNGPGIPHELQSRIFEPFFTTKGVGQGSGLGLDISYRVVVNRHGGAIRVTSQSGDTRFEIRLPLHQRRPLTK